MNSYLQQWNAGYIDTLRQQYEENPQHIEPTWRAFFEGFQSGEAAAADSAPDVHFEMRVVELVEAYRELGHLCADVNPLQRGQKSHDLLSLARFGLTEDDLTRRTHAGEILGLPGETLGDILALLRACYCAPVTVELDHISDLLCRRWVQQKVESGMLAQPLSTDWKRRTLKTLTACETLETFIHKRFVAAKRFSVEGNDALLPMLDALIQHASAAGTDEIIIGMAHRGRLNVLANIFHKNLTELFAEFSGNMDTGNEPGDGDVKYHLGHAQDVSTDSGLTMSLRLAFNPSHLEAVNSVVMGMVREKQTRRNDTERMRTIALLLHGDASFEGQGSIYETLNMSRLAGYDIGGTVHIVVNNQIGFTTSPAEGRSTLNATDVAKMLQVPILRVNADEPEACVRAIQFALEFRNAFKRDVFIDLLGYRRFGHNEGDEPAFTQPQLYQQISEHARVRELYAQRLIAEGVVTADEAEQWLVEQQTRCETALEAEKAEPVVKKLEAFSGQWKGLEAVPQDERIFESVHTGVPAEQLENIGKALLQVPEGFTVLPKIQRFLADRADMLSGKRGIDWSLGEALAFGSLIAGGTPVRLAGQDVERGTFSHRHAVFKDVTNGQKYIALNNLRQGNANIELVNSLLSEFAAMGFEFGQSMSTPHKLVLWEAQFGDFANGAQVIIDQFISASAAKWRRFSGLTLLLPHGYEGQGPEHSSARLERYLQACAQNNIQVCNFTTPAQYFHALRRQMLRTFRFPLVITTPKSLLRHPQATSTMQEFSQGRLHEVIGDPTADTQSKRIVLCSGKIYYDLLAARQERRFSLPLIRIEQLYPFPAQQVAALLKQYGTAQEIIWCQEEPQNMGAWTFMHERLLPLLDREQRLQYVGRPPQASTAGGYAQVHEREQRAIVARALG